MSFECISEIEKMCDAVSREELANTQRRLTPQEDRDQSVGVLHDERLRRLYCVVGKYRTLAHVSLCEANGPVSEAEEARLRGTAYRSAQMSDTALEILWSEIQQTMCGWHVAEVGLREDWMVVDTGADDNGRLRPRPSPQRVRTVEPSPDVMRSFLEQMGIERPEAGAGDEEEGVQR